MEELDSQKIKAIVFTGIIVLAIILIFIVAVTIVLLNQDNTNKNINIHTGFQSIEEILKHYDCEYKNETYNEKREYPTEINLVFKCDLYENEESNEKFYNNLIQDIAKFLNYTNFKMLDTTREITVEVICAEGKIQIIKINGMVDYFIYMDSQLAVTKYKEIETTNLIPEAPTLQELINTSWASSINMGTRESIFQNYNICFDEGIEYRKIGSNIYNVIYTKKYTGPVINGLQVGMELRNIERSLGKAPFKDEELNVVGYKGKDMYVFFTEDEISIYRNIEYDNTDFWNLCERFLNDDLDFKNFMNELTYLWKDYSEYTYDSDYMFISYPNRGIDVKLNYEEISGIVIYNNFSEDLNTTKQYLQHTEFVSRLQLDNVFEAEKRRIQKENLQEKTCEEFKQELKDNLKEGETLMQKTSYLYDYYMEKDEYGYTIATYFISRDGNNVNRELNEPIDTYLWANDYYLIYSIPAQGIYLYDVINGVKIAITEEGENFKINSYENNILKFGDKDEIQLVF